jgi:hypothetical protein
MLATIRTTLAYNTSCTDLHTSVHKPAEQANRAWELLKK